MGDFDQLSIDFDVYALVDGTVRRHQSGIRDESSALERPPGEAAPDYRLVDGSGRDVSDGRLYLHDAAADSIVAFGKIDGRYLGGWVTSGGEIDDIRGMYVIEGGLTTEGQRKDDTLVWITPAAIYRASLPLTAARADDPAPDPSPAPLVDAARDDLLELSITTSRSTWTR